MVQNIEEVIVMEGLVTKRGDLLDKPSGESSTKFIYHWQFTIRSLFDYFQYEWIYPDGGNVYIFSGNL